MSHRNVCRVLFASLLTANLWGCASTAGVWPSTSDAPAPVLPHPSLDERIESLEYQLEGGFRFIAFGDQRALADGEWQAMMRVIGGMETRAAEPPTLFLLDTGDIVQDGSHSDQFGVLRDILSPASHLPYLLTVGNHEVDNNRPGPGRQNLARFISGAELPITAEQGYYARDIGPMRLICLDTNDLVYGRPAASRATGAAGGDHARRQLEWFQEQLQPGPDRPPLTVVAMHHPLVQTSRKHRDSARDLWSMEWNDRRLVDIMADGGVDLVVTGHTHTYERFTLERADGASLQLINLSGRPRNNFLWFGAGSRRARDLAGEDADWFSRQGWELGDWQIRQDDVLRPPERNQFALFTVGPRGDLDFQLWLIDRDPPHRVETLPSTTLWER